MKVIDALLQVYRVDGQLRGLRSRLSGSERFVTEQQRQIEELKAKQSSIQSQLRQIDTVIADRNGEADRLQARIDELRERMNTAQTNKEYKALLTEVNTLKADKSKLDDEALEQMSKAEAVRDQLTEIKSGLAEREKVLKVAEAKRDEGLSEVSDRLKELETERAKLVADVPPEVLATYEALVEQLEDEAMAAVHELDRRKHEYTCGSCMMSIPVETVSVLVRGEQLTRCANCRCILYLDAEASEAIQSTLAKQR